MNRESSAGAALAAVTAAGMQADILIASLFGAAFFMMLPFIESLLRRAAMSFLSVGFGYSVGVAAPGGHAMWVAAVGAALAVILLTSISTYLHTASLPDVMERVAAFIRGLK